MLFRSTTIGISGAGAVLGQSTTPGWVIVISAAEIFAVPFLIRMSLSPLARVCSATLALAIPFALGADVLYQAHASGGDNLTAIYVLLAFAMACLALASFLILDGPSIVGSGKTTKAKRKE